MRFKKGDLLTTKNSLVKEPVVRVERVTRKGVVHCVNLIACQMMSKGDEFSFVPDEWTWYVLHSRK